MTLQPAQGGQRFAPARAWIQVSARKHGIPVLDGVFPARAEADIASDTPQIWGSPRGDDDRNGPARQS